MRGMLGFSFVVRNILDVPPTGIDSIQDPGLATFLE
jgi:hypothetical protein